MLSICDVIVSQKPKRRTRFVNVSVRCVRYTPLYEKGIKKTQNNKETTDGKSCYGLLCSLEGVC